MKQLNDKKDITKFLGNYPLLAASLRVTMGCNATCSHCYANAGSKIEHELKKEEILDIIDQLKGAGASQIFFTGGEPFIRKDIIDILKYADLRGLKILISTNGSVLSERIIKEIAYIPFEQFQVSLDGLQDTHDANRGKGFFEKAVNAIDMLQIYNVKNITIGTCITKYNIREISQILQFVINKKIEKFAIMLLLPEGRANREMDVEIHDLVNEMGKFWETYENNKIEFQFASNSVLPPVLIPKRLRDKGIHEQFLMCCSYPNLFGIGASGEVAPCDGFLNWESFKGGNVRDHSINELWETMYTNSDIIPNDVTHIEGICSKCIYLQECCGNCRADSISYYGDITAPYPVCQKLFDNNLFPKECMIG